MKITFYKNNKVTDAVVSGKVVDLTFDQLLFNFKYPVFVDIPQNKLFELKNSTNEDDNKKYLALKDTGFFIGGEVDINSKSRKADKVLNRTILTFDIDFPTCDIWQKFKDIFTDIYAIKYSTISANDTNPRFRLLVPINRPVNNAEYLYLMKYVMAKLGDAEFDSTTSEISRIMFLPAVCNDQKYVLDSTGSKYFNVDMYLSLNEKISAVDNSINTKEINAINPKEKSGVVGAFNRAFSITDTIDMFLSNIYIKSGDNNSLRYKYKDSKGMPGARVYNDNTRFYSAHDTDPAHLQNLDAFNLVKIHLFGGDFSKCREWALGLSEVKAELETEETTGSDTTNWVSLLYKEKKTGRLMASLYNIQMILLNDKHLAGMFRLNTLTYMIEVCKDMENIGGASNRKFKTLEDADITEVQIYLETSEYNIRPGKQLVIDVVCQVARLNKYNPVKDYLNSLSDSWDGVSRIPTMFTDYLMVKDSPIMRKIARKIMAAAIKRIMLPGIKWEGVPVLRGIQGCGKSTFIQKLYKSSMYDAEPKNWVNNTAVDYSNIDKAIQRTKSFWGIELAEMASSTLSNFSNEQMKAFISADRPVTRIPYDKFEITIDRQCIFWGTTNVWSYISDQTGARRFLPIDCGAKTEEDKFICLQKINSMDVDQLWAEAMSYYTEEPLFFTVDEERELNTMRAMHTEESNYEALLSKFINSKITIDWDKKSPMERRDFFQTGGNPTEAIVERKAITLSEICYEALGDFMSKTPRKALREIEITMFNLGWQISPTPTRTVYGQSKTFIRVKDK